MPFIVTDPHRSEFPQPITLKRGDVLQVGERYQGPEDWNDWYLCEAAGQVPGWVPAQVIVRDAAGAAVAGEDYCAHELDVDPGQAVEGGHVLNGWVWCTPVGGGIAGWVPLRVLRAV